MPKSAPVPRQWPHNRKTEGSRSLVIPSQNRKCHSFSASDVAEEGVARTHRQGGYPGGRRVSVVPDETLPSPSLVKTW